jgi:potassium/hydrogen antiporter
MQGSSSAEADPSTVRAQSYGELALYADAPVADVARFYGLPLDDNFVGTTLGAYIAAALHARPKVGRYVQLGKVHLVIRQLDHDRIAKVGLRLAKSQAAQSHTRSDISRPPEEECAT